MTLTVGSLFSGIGGLDLGMERAGMTIRWQVEIDDYCQRVLAKHWPDVTRFTDINDLDGEELEPVDLISAGFPCQPVSLAGQRKGQNDERWLWPATHRIICLVRPRFVLLENVTGLLSRGMSDVLGDLAESGYDAEWDCIPAAAVGAPHLRKRIWIFANTVSLRRSVFRASIQGCSCLEQQNGNRETTLRGENRNIVALVDGIHPRTPEDWWRTQSRMDRSAYGVSNRVDRLRGLGNAVVPQVAEWIGRRIVEAA